MALSPPPAARILVVDDDRPQAEEFGVLLRHAGCAVTLPALLLPVTV